MGPVAEHRARHHRLDHGARAAAVAVAHRLRVVGEGRRPLPQHPRVVVVTAEAVLPDRPAAPRSLRHAASPRPSTRQHYAGRSSGSREKRAMSVRSGLRYHARRSVPSRT